MKTEFIWVTNMREYPEYYLQIFGEKKISKALGICVHYDDCKEWLLAIQDGQLLGFSGYETTSSAFVLKRSYVFEKFRGLGIYKKMLDIRIDKATKSSYKIIQATTTPLSKKEFEKRGFISSRQFKKYQTFRLML